MTRRLNAWLTPDSVSGETLSRCLTFPRELLPYVTGALSALTEPWRWEQFGTMTPSEAAYLASAMLSQFLNDCEGSNVLLRQNPTDGCILERSDDNGVTWVAFADLSACAERPPETTVYPDDMRLNPTTGELEYSLDDGVTWYDYPVPNEAEPEQPYAPLRESQPGASDYERRCAAASSAAVALSQMYEHTYGAVGAGIVNTWGAFANFMNEVTDFVFGITYGQVWDIVKIIGLWDPIDWQTNYAAAALTEQQIELLTCLIYDNTLIDGNGVAQVDFGAVRDNVISTLGLNPGTAVWTHLNYLQETGLERIMDVGFGTSNCGCGTWCIEFDFTQDDYGWYPVVSDWARGAYSAGVGWTAINGTDSHGTKATDLYIRLDFDTPATITGVSVIQDLTLGGGSPYCRVLNVGGDVWVNQQGGCQQGSNIDWIVNDVTEDASYVILRSQTALTVWGGSATIKRVRITGTGLPPVSSYTEACEEL